MNYPNFEKKYLQESLFHPEDYIAYLKLKNKKFPKKYIITYQRGAKRYFLKKYKPKKHHLYSLLDIYVYKNIGFIKMNGIGASLSAAILEELIALGGKEFLNIGTAGGLKKEGIILCEKALRDEGTSYHYIPKGKFAYPDKSLTIRLEKLLKKINIPFMKGATWTIDAPYRETKAEIEKYSKQGIYTVEMEASALFSVAKYRNVKIASVFIVSDLLGKKWLPKFHRFNVKRAQNDLIDVAINFFRNRTK